MTDPRESNPTQGLDAALAATRRRFDGRSESAHVTERRILAAARPRWRPRKSLWLFPVAAAFLGSAAFAEGLGERLSDLKTRFFAPPSEAPAQQPSALPPRSSPTGTPRFPFPPSEPSAAELPPAPTHRASPSAAVQSTTTDPPRVRSKPPGTQTPSSQVGPTSSGPETNAPGDLALYKAAHTAHFAERDYARALTAWDRYLSLAPRGTFALEARFNRAIALHRLGRRSEAVEALTPFAEGAYGRYRQDEARELIETLR